MGVEAHLTNSAAVLPNVDGRKSSNGVFELERTNAMDGTGIRWNETFRLRHLASGRLLCLHNPNPATADTTPAKCSSKRKSAEPRRSAVAVPEGLSLDEIPASDGEEEEEEEEAPDITQSKKVRLGAALAGASSAPEDAARNVKLELADGDAVDEEHCLFVLEPLYTNPDEHVTFACFFRLKLATRDLWVHLSGAAGEKAETRSRRSSMAPTAVRRFVASSHWQETDIFEFHTVGQEMLYDLNYVTGSLEPMRSFAGQFELDETERGSLRFAPATRRLEELIRFATFATDNPDPITREGLPHESRQMILHEQGVLSVAMRCATTPFTSGKFDHDELTRARKNERVPELRRLCMLASEHTCYLNSGGTANMHRVRILRTC